MQYRAKLAACKFPLLALALLVATAPAFAVTVILEPSQDNSIYEDFPTNSNALGITLFTGNTGSSTRRALLQFDVAGNIPAGATIASVQLDVTVDSAGPFAIVGNPYDLFRLDESWGEGTSSGSQTAGVGVAATPGDATWDARFYDAITPTLWATPGGTLAVAASATTGLPVGGSVSWLSTPSLVADVQDMLDNPGDNHGWAVVPDATNAARTARRLFSREEAIATARPRLIVVFALSGGTVQLEPSADNSIYADFPDNSNALGVTLFSGNTGSSSRRALLAFDIAGNVPTGATILNVQLDVNVGGAGPFSTAADPFPLFRVTEDWGEGTSLGFSTAGVGVAATVGDATWNARFWDALTPTLWSTPGGTLAFAASALTNLPTFGAGSWLTTPQLVADVQDMLDNPGTDFGWAVLPVMTNPARSARRFSSREEPNVALRPLLTIGYASGPSRRGEVPDGDDVPAVPLTLSKALTPAIKLDWSASCRASDTDYGVYEGTIGGLFDNHQQVVCSTAGALTHTLTPNSTRSYYLVVPNDGTDEGSYGDGSNDVERPQGTMFCFAQNIGSPVCP